MNRFNDPSTCYEYKEYSTKWLPQNRTLEGYEVDDFKVDSNSKLDMFDQVNEYIRELEPYSTHLLMAANLRQQHFEKYIRGMYIEDPDHAYWRIGFNRVAEDTIRKFEYWCRFKDKMFTKLIQVDEARRIVENKRTWADVDSKIKNVDYNEKVVSKEVVRQPRISNAEKKKNRKARRLEEEEAIRVRREKRMKEDEMINDLITSSEKMRELAKQEFVENGGVIASDLMSEFKRGQFDESTAFARAINHPNRKLGGRILIDFESDKHMVELAKLYFDLRDHFTANLMNYLNYLFHYKEFRKVYIEMAFRDMKYDKKNRECILVLASYIEAGELGDLKRFYSHRYSKDRKSKQLMVDFLELLLSSRHTAMIYERIMYFRHLIVTYDGESDDDSDDYDADDSDSYNSDYYDSYDDPEDRYESIDFANFQGRLDHLTDMEQKMYVDSDIMDMFYEIRRLVCDMLELDEQRYIDIDKNTKKAERCDDPSCKTCNPVHFCKCCHKKFGRESSDDDY